MAGAGLSHLILDTSSPMPNPLLETVRVHLEARHLTAHVLIESDHYDPQMFGNAYVILVAEGLRVRLVKDRGQLFADLSVGGRESDWFDLQRTVEANRLDTSSLLVAPHGAEVISPEAVVDYVWAHRAVLKNALPTVLS